MSEVISLQKKKDEKSQEATAEAAKPKTKEELDSEAYFAEIQAKNEAKKQKLAKERNGANKGVLRSYRIKN